MHSLTSKDRFVIPGRGVVFSMDKSQIPEDMDSPGDFKDTEVIIDGVRYLVTGVEMFAIHVKRYRHAFGLIVREVKISNMEIGRFVLYTTPNGRWTLVGYVNQFDVDSGNLRIDFPSIGRWVEGNYYTISEGMRSRIVVVDDDAVWGREGVVRND